MLQKGPSLGPQIRQNRTKSPYRKQHKKHMQKVSKYNAKPEAQHLPKQAFRLKRLHFLSFAASSEKCSKWAQKAPWNDPQIRKIRTGGLPKAMPKINIKNGTNKMHKNQIWDPKLSKIASQNGVEPLTFWGLDQHCLRSCLWEAPGPPKSWPNRTKTWFLRYFFHGLLHSLQHTLSSRKNSQRKSL